MKKYILIITFVFIALVSVGCKKEEETEGIYFSFTEDLITTTVNEVTTLPINTNLENLSEITYSFSIPGAATVENNTITFTTPGSFTVIAYWEKDGGFADMIHVIVNDIERSISLEYNSLNLFLDETYDLHFNLNNLTLSDLAFRLSDKGIVTITDDWKIEPNNIGTVTLTIFYINNDEVYFDLPIIIKDKPSIDFAVDQIEIEKNYPLPITLKGINPNEIEFSLDKEDIIKIENNEIIPLKVGSVIITAVLKSNLSINATLTVKVNDVKPTYKVTEYEYWIENLNSEYSSTETILSSSEINQYNNSVFSDYSLTKTLDLFTQPKTITKTSLESMINYYQIINKYNIYNNGTIIQDSEKAIIMSNRNMSQIPDTVNLKYGIVTDFAALRSYPTNYYSSSNAMDRFQETGLNVGEGVIVYHTSLDGKWYFIQAQNYNGWVETKNIALCSYEEMDGFLNSENFVIVTADKLLINNVFVRMGQRIPYTSKTNESYIIHFPTRVEDGSLFLKEMNLDSTLDLSDGYLDYTIENVYKQGFKMLGIPYSWGDKNVDGRDCSSTQNAIYACFGFILPRNTSNQSKIPTYSKSVLKGTFSATQLKTYYNPGTLIFTSSHVLMYLGEDANGNSYVLHNTNGGVPGCKVETLSSYGTSNIIATLKLYK